MKEPTIVVGIDFGTTYSGQVFLKEIHSCIANDRIVWHGPWVDLWKILRLFPPGQEARIVSVLQ